MPEIVNVDQAAAWDGPSGDAWVRREQMQNEALRAYSERLFDVAAVAPADRVLDVGCGTGDTTRQCARLAVDGGAVGVDLSAAMLDRARERAADEGLTNAEFVQADAQVHAFPPASFDLVVSRFGVMYFGDPVAAFTNIARATAPGGRLAAVVWQDFARNEWVTEPWAALAMGRAIPTPPAGSIGPFGFADPDHVRAVLDAAGFTNVQLEDFAAPFWLGADADTAVKFACEIGVMHPLLADLDADATARATEALRAVVVAHESERGVELDSRTWIVTANR
jgi:SAM-dependent methyltransferase